MNLTASIESAELRFRQILEDFFVSVYNEKNLYSHGIDHHRRVWHYARELLFIPFIDQNSLPPCSPSDLIIACYLHDIGMSVEPGPRHGIVSRDMCLQFLQKNNLNIRVFKEVLDTIEYHDRKDYLTETGQNDLLNILSVADDLDAFGFTGIYRYSEIYLTRGITPVQTGYLISENAKKRFDNFERIFGRETFYVKIHRKRYEILKNFFIHFNKQAMSYDFKSSDKEGYCGVIQLFILMISNKMSLHDFFLDAEFYQDDVVIGSYIDGLKSELSSDSEHMQE
jgi:hypothetical protein